MNSSVIEKFEAVMMPIAGKVSSNKYVLKANWIDHTHARNIVSANLWSQIVASREDYDTLPEELDKVCRVVKEAMESVAELRVPLIAEVNHGSNWLEAH